MELLNANWLCNNNQNNNQVLIMIIRRQDPIFKSHCMEFHVTIVNKEKRDGSLSF